MTAKTLRKSGDIIGYFKIDKIYRGAKTENRPIE